MSNCMTLIVKPVGPEHIATWETVSDFVGNVETQPISNLCLLNGEYVGDPIYFDYIDCPLVTAIMFHECTGDPEVDAIIGQLTEINQHTFTIEDGKLCYRMTGWCIPTPSCDPVDEDPIISLPDICENPCDRMIILENLLAQLMAGKMVVNASYGQRSMSFRAADKACLERWYREAMMACNACRGIQTHPRSIRWRCW